ncbi:MAG: UvrD-helicase domain-containing protein, partial [Rhodopirellula sp.]|nr:UvrD-helicase domain-containing protein [Rhodopirellula sp.]
VLHRIQHGLKPERTLLLTFDNAAVNSIKLKLHDKFAELGVELSGLRVLTLNAFGYSILRDCFHQEYKPVIASRRQYSLLKTLRNQLRQHSSEHFGALPEYLAGRFYLEFFSLLKNNLFDPCAVDAQAMTDFLLEAPQAEVFYTNPSERAVTKTIQAIIWLYQGYERLLQRERTIDFDDQKLRPYVLLQQNLATLGAIQGQVDEVVVDEFQDINRLDFVLVQAIADKATLVVTGDDDQAIYGFRGCTPQYIIDLEKHLRRPIESHELQVNYRCPPVIVEHADRLIRHNTWRIPKTPRAAGDAVAQIHVVSSLSAGLEAKSIVSLIQRVRADDAAVRFRDFAVLYRANAQSLPLQVEFVLNGIPYYVRKEDNIVENEQLRKLLSILRTKLALDQGTAPSKEDAARTVCSFFRYIEPHAAARLEAAIKRSETFLSDVNSQAFYDLMPDRGRDLLPMAMRELIRTPSLLATLHVIAEKFYGVYGMIGSLEDVVAERVPLGEVFEIAAGFRGDTRDFVQTLEGTINRARESNAGQDHREGVPLLTYFRSKGLQWHTVILTTSNEGLIPHVKAEVEGERRLFYVAMTRASSNLFVSYVENACGSKVAPSRFLYESGLLEKEPKKRKKGLERLGLPPRPVPASVTPAPPGGYVASKTSIVFHLPGCSVAKKIGEKNIVKFATREEAVHARKHPCSKCKP